MKYKINSKFYVRVPYFSYNFFSEELKKISDYKTKKNFILENFKESLFINSPSLYNNILRDEGSKSDLEETIEKYLIRAATRPTPFGLNAGVMNGLFTGRSEVEIGKFRKNIRPDFTWFIKILKMVEKDLGEDLLVRKNERLIIDSFNIHLPRTTMYSDNEELNESITVEKLPALELVLKCTDTFVSKKSLYIKVKDTYKDIDKKFFMDYLDQLLAKEILISNLRPTLKRNDLLSELIQKIDSKKNYGDLISKLRKLIERFKDINGTEIDSKETIIDLSDSLKNLVEAEKYLHVDMYSDSLVEFPNLIQRDVQEFINFISKFSFYDSYDSYIAEFRNKFGEQLVPVTVMLDPNAGLGIPEKRVNEKVKFLDNFYLSFFEMFEKSIHSDESDIKLEKLTSFLHDDKKDNIEEKGRDLRSLEISLFIGKGKQGDIIYEISPMVGSTHSQKSRGRFNYLLKSLEKVHEDEVDTVFFPNNTNNANVMCSSPISNKILATDLSIDDNAQITLHLSDIYAGVSGDKIVFFDRNDGKQINFFSSNMFRIDRFPIEIRTLLELSWRQEKFPLEFVLQLQHVIEHVNFDTPRITYKNVIIIPRSWKLSEFFSDRIDYSTFEKKLEEVRGFKKIPNSIYFGVDDNKIILDLTNPLHKKILFNSLKKNVKLPIYENLFEQYSPILERKQHTYIGEFVFSATLQKEERRYLVKNEAFNTYHEDKENIRLPFTNWISLKLYMSKYSEDIFISRSLVAFVNRLSSENILKDFFFIRYKDPEEHLRVRFELNSDKQKDFITLYDNFISEIPKDILGNIVIDTYKPEVFRYGGEENLNSAHKAFFQDSLWSIQRVSAQLLNGYPYSEIEEAYMDIYNLVDTLKIPKERLLKYLSAFKNQSIVFKNYRKFVEKLRKTVPSRIDDEIFGNELYFYWQEIEMSISDEKRKAYILQSLIHMRFNRVIGINRELENKACYYFYKSLVSEIKSQNRRDIQ